MLPNDLLHKLSHALVGVALLTLAAAPVRGQEAELRLVKDGAGGIVVHAIPDASYDSWNLYRGDLTDMPSYLQYGDPDGRCDIGSPLDVTLLGELSATTNAYYLASLVQGGVEQTLGTGVMMGQPRPNNFPCPTPQNCGTEIIAPTDIRGTEGIAVAPDGTVYYSQSSSIGRRLPGSAPEPSWVATSGRVYGLALRDDGMLFACINDTTDEVVRVDTTLPTPVPTRLYSEPGFPNGIIIDPTGVAIYSDFTNDAIYRLTDTGARVEVTVSPINTVNGLLLDDDGSLLALEYSSGNIWRLQLDGTGLEIGRSLAGTLVGARVDGIGKDELGRYYVTDNSGGRLIRLDASFANPEVLATGLSAAANIAFGQGALDCTDVYITSSGNLGRVNVGVGGRP